MFSLSSLRNCVIGVWAALVLVGLAACDDGPTAPGVYSHEAEGRVWSAVREPASLPTLRTWLTYVRPGTPEADSALGQVRALQAEADRLRRAGQADTAAAVETRAALVAIRAINRPVVPYVLSIALAGLSEWSDVAAGADRSELFVPSEAVRARRRAASAALERGDTVAAAEEIALATSEARALSPAAVASRALAETEQRLAAVPNSDPDVARALRLLRNAREAIASGDDARALRRAVYALQLADATTRRLAAPAPAGPGAAVQ